MYFVSLLYILGVHYEGSLKAAICCSRSILSASPWLLKFKTVSESCTLRVIGLPAI